MVQDEINREFSDLAEKQSPLPDQDIKTQDIENNDSLRLPEQKQTSHNFKQGPVNKKGKYLYCIVKTSEDKKFAQIGIDGNKVYTICHKGLAAVIHDCKDKPYESNEEKLSPNGSWPIKK